MGVNSSFFVKSPFRSQERSSLATGALPSRAKAAISRLSLDHLRRKRSSPKASEIQVMMVVNAVRIEPVSTANFLLTGKRTGNFAETGLLLAILTPNPQANSMICG
jgi:hypothetical protein